MKCIGELKINRTVQQMDNLITFSPTQFRNLPFCEQPQSIQRPTNFPRFYRKTRTASKKLFFSKSQQLIEAKTNRDSYLQKNQISKPQHNYRQDQFFCSQPFKEQGTSQNSQSRAVGNITNRQTKIFKNFRVKPVLTGRKKKEEMQRCHKAKDYFQLNKSKQKISDLQPLNSKTNLEAIKINSVKSPKHITSFIHYISSYPKQMASSKCFGKIGLELIHRKIIRSKSGLSNKHQRQIVTSTMKKMPTNFWYKNNQYNY